MRATAPCSLRLAQSCIDDCRFRLSLQYLDQSIPALNHEEIIAPFDDGARRVILIVDWHANLREVGAGIEFIRDSMRGEIYFRVTMAKSPFESAGSPC